MTDTSRRQLAAALAQITALKEQAVAIGMQAETLERTVQAIRAAPVAEEPPPDGGIASEVFSSAKPFRPRHYNGCTCQHCVDPAQAT